MAQKEVPSSQGDEQKERGKKCAKRHLCLNGRALSGGDGSQDVEQDAEGNP